MPEVSRVEFYVSGQSLRVHLFRQFVRSTPAPTVGQKLTGGICKRSKTARACRGGQLLDNILDWEHDLPERDLGMAINHARLVFDTF